MHFHAASSGLIRRLPKLPGPQVSLGRPWSRDQSLRHPRAGLRCLHRLRRVRLQKRPRQPDIFSVASFGALNRTTMVKRRSGETFSPGRGLTGERQQSNGCRRASGRRSNATYPDLKALVDLAECMIGAGQANVTISRMGSMTTPSTETKPLADVDGHAIPDDEALGLRVDGRLVSRGCHLFGWFDRPTPWILSRHEAPGAAQEDEKPCSSRIYRADYGCGSLPGHPKCTEVSAQNVNLVIIQPRHAASRCKNADPLGGRPKSGRVGDWRIERRPTRLNCSVAESGGKGAMPGVCWPRGR